MTARAILNRRVRWIMSIFFIGGGAFVLSIFLSQGLGIPEAYFVGLPGFAVAWLTGAYAYLWGIRCPACRGNLAYVVMARMGPRLSISPSIKFCPYCGVDFDAEHGLPPHTESTEAA
jgi:hypothetical protein